MVISQSLSVRRALGADGRWNRLLGRQRWAPCNKHSIWTCGLGSSSGATIFCSDGLSKAHNLSVSSSIQGNTFITWLFHNNCLMGYFISGIRMKWHIHTQALNFFCVCVYVCVVLLFEVIQNTCVQRFIFPEITTPSITCPNNWNFCMRAPSCFLFKLLFVLFFLAATHSLWDLRSPWPGTEPGTPQGKFQLVTTRVPENSWEPLLWVKVWIFRQSLKITFVG